MAAPWPQGAPPMQNYAPVNPPPPVARRSTNPPPVCFNCGRDHFLVACPQQSKSVPSGLLPTPSPYQQPPGPYPQAQGYHAQGGPVQAQYPPYQPNPQYGPPTPQYPYGQPPVQQPYTIPPHQYGRPGFPQPQYNQYPQPSGPPPFNNPGYQGPPTQFGQPVASYQPQPTPYPSQNPGYGSNFQQQPRPYQGPQPVQPIQHPQPPQSPQQQWNHGLPSTQPAYQQFQPPPPPQRKNSNHPQVPGTPNHQMQRQRSVSQQVDRNSQAFHHTPQQTLRSSAAMSTETQQSVRRESHGSIKAIVESQASSRASTPYGQYGSPTAAGNTEETQKLSEGQDGVEKPEEGEVGEADDEEALFNWDYKHIFIEPAGLETVALAQPLSAGCKSTPVPLVQAWTMTLPSISRYARKDNLKEFIRPIRESPQWSYLQEDPAFVSDDLNGPAVPFDELGAWIDAHHERLEAPELNSPTDLSRKRARSGEFEEDDQDQDQCQIEDEAELDASAHDEPEGPPIKRQKYEEDAGVHDELMRTPNVSTPVVRNGTPVFETDDDAWAPQPGENASTPQDPTEALLASLGVEGSPKPVQKEPPPSYMNDLEEVKRQTSESSQPPVNDRGSRHASVSSNAKAQSVSGQGHNDQHAHDQQGDTHQYGPSTNTSSAGGPPANHFPGNGLLGNFTQSNQQHGPPANHTSQNGPPQNGPPHQGPPQLGAGQQGPRQGYMNGNPQHGPQVNGYGNPPPNNFPQNGYQAPHTNNSFNNGHSDNFSQQGPPQQSHTHQGAPQWGPPQNTPYQNGPPQGHPQYVPPMNTAYNSQQQHGPHNSGPPLQPYGNGPAPYDQQRPPQVQQAYGPNRAPSFENSPQMQNAYGAPSQCSPTNYGPPKNTPYNANQYPNSQSHPQYNYGPAGPNGHGPPNNAPYQNMPPQYARPPNHGPHINGPPQQPQVDGPPRQDSGYMSARGSYSNGAEQQQQQQQFNNQKGAGNSDPQSGMNGNTSDSNRDNTSHIEHVVSQPATRNTVDHTSVETGSDGPGTPLSPFSMEILGKLNRSSSNGKSPESGSRENARKVKRPQPVVAEAYSRRW